VVKLSEQLNKVARRWTPYKPHIFPK